MDRFDSRGYIVRKLFGAERHQSFEVPGIVEKRELRFKYGIAVQAQSLQDALELLNHRQRKSQRESAA